MQILPATGQSLAIETQRPWAGERTLFDPYLNLSLGVRYLAKLQKRFGALDVALVAYNYGPSRVDEMLRRGEPLPTEYTRRVLTRYREFLALQDASSL
jgi:soluble lytic murein transglycosylase-like protein